MPGFREKFIQATSGVVKHLPIAFWQKISGQRLIFPFYHLVSDVDLPHINQLYSIKSVDQFKEDLDFLLTYFNPISYADLQEYVKRDSFPDKPSFLLSFDDGLREFHDVVAPILLEKGIPAICFLNSGFIDNTDLMYRYKASLLINEILTNPELVTQLPQNFPELDYLRQSLLDIDYENRHILDKIAKSIGYSFEDYLSQNQPYLNTTQIEILIEKGFHFGGHSIDHQEYQSMDFDAQLRQTKGSVDSVCNAFKLDYKTFSFPFTDYGISKDLFDEFQKRNIVDISFGCAGQRQESVRNHFQRIAFEMGDLTGQEILNAELLYYSLKRPFGKNLIERD